MKPCIPAELQALAVAAARRKEEALDNMIRVASAAPAPDGGADAFERAMRALIDADKAALEEVQRRKS